MMVSAIRKIANFYSRYENVGLKIAFILISLQIIHLFWLTSDVVLQRITGESFFPFPQEEFGRELFLPFIIVDYLEIPAIVAGVAFYALRVYKNPHRSRNDVIFLVFLAVQVFHIFWLTDEMVYEVLLESNIADIPPYLAWVAILIDYLEIPVIADLFRRVWRQST
jgi:hypothetical protein